MDNMKKFDLGSEQIVELKNILGNDYDEVHEFYYKACVDEKYKYKIFLTRRSYVLYKIFVLIFQYENPDFRVCGEIYNSHSVKTMELEKDDVLKSKILVLDDIIINGRTVDKIFRELKNIFGDRCIENTTVWCIVRNQEANCLKEALTHFGHFRYVTPDEWRKLSNKLTKFIVSSNIGYVSFIDTFYMDKKHFTMIEDRFLDIEKYSRQSLQFNEAGVKSSIYFYQFSNLNAEKYNIKTCVRLYEKESSITVIPYVFLPEILKSKCVAYCTELLSLFCINVPDKIKQPGHEALLYQWTINELSKQILHCFCEDLLGYAALSCNESFKPYLYPTVQNQKLYSSNLKSKDVIECCEIFKNTLINASKENNASKDLHDGFENVLQSYLSKMHKLDEERAINEEDRYKGIKVQDILDILGSNDFRFDEYKVLGAIINSWDIGKSSYLILEDCADNGESVIAGFIRNGEQAYRIVYEQYNFQYRVFYYLFLKTYICEENIIKTIANALDKKFNTEAFGKFYREIDFYNYFSDLLSVEPIVDTREERYFNQMKEFINEYLKTGKLN